MTIQGYGKTSSKRDYILEDELLTRPSDFGRVPFDRHSYRDAYPSRESGYLGSPPRKVSRAAARRPSPPYDDYIYGRYVERPSNYRDSHISDYSANASSKRPHSTLVSYLFESPFMCTAVFPHLFLIKSNPAFLGRSSPSLC